MHYITKSDDGEWVSGTILSDEEGDIFISFSEDVNVRHTDSSQSSFLPVPPTPSPNVPSSLWPMLKSCSKAALPGADHIAILPTSLILSENWCCPNFVSFVQAHTYD